MFETPPRLEVLPSSPFTFSTATPEADTIEALTDRPLGFDGESFDPAVLVWLECFSGRRVL